jgi:hypothetical protein
MLVRSRKTEREVATPVPLTVVPPLEQGERVYDEAGHEISQSVVGEIQCLVGHIVGNRHMGVVRKVEVSQQRPAANDSLQLLATGDSTRDLDENHGRRRPERSGTQQVHDERRGDGGGLAEMLFDLGQLTPR